MSATDKSETEVQNELDAPRQEKPGDDLKRYIIYGMISFVVVGIGIFCISSFMTPSPDEGYPVTEQAQPESDMTFRLTVDTSSTTQWVNVDLSAGKRVDESGPIDIKMRRYAFQVPGGAINLGSVKLADATVGENPNWLADTVSTGALQNPGIGKWYEYSYMSHLLKSKNDTYAVRLHSQPGAVAYVRIVSYYCKPTRAGCVTLRYRLGRK
jgi:hypothetical protein